MLFHFLPVSEFQCMMMITCKAASLFLLESNFKNCVSLVKMLAVVASGNV